jgi:hypothetical protein
MNRDEYYSDYVIIIVLPVFFVRTKIPAVIAAAINKRNGMPKRSKHNGEKLLQKSCRGVQVKV